ncbi:Type 1 glutamine amidotransferase-like domain-containing protein [bacterium]|nr:Type 1 glutamine amidotransferase-like domain-containing protein [bacterium]
MKKLYLFSLINNFTLPNFEDFLRESSQGDFKLLVLMQIDQQKSSVLDYISHSQVQVDINKIHFLAPEINDKCAPQDTLKLLKEASGILVLGGNAHFYQKIYASPEICQIVQEKYSLGTPYAGVSAGAILSLNYNLLTDLALKPHFSEKKRFTELIAKMKKNRVKYGFGLDDNISLKIIDNNLIKCVGKDSFYLFTKHDINEYSFKILKNLDEVEIS